MTPDQEEFFAYVGFVEDWRLGCAYAAGRASVIESAEMAVVVEAAEAEAATLDHEVEVCYAGFRGRPTDLEARAAAIRAAIERLKP